MQQPGRNPQPHPYAYAKGPAWHGRPGIVPTENDVLMGRGTNIAHLPGNLRLRALVRTFADDSYCDEYETSQKIAVAKLVIAHIRSLQPPGRFLKRPSGSGKAKGRKRSFLEGPWEEMAEQEAIKKVTQSLRDCNRQDRNGYAQSVEVPEDVKRFVEDRRKSGLTNKQLAAQAAATDEALLVAEQLGKRPASMARLDGSATGGSVSPSVAHAAGLLKKQRTQTDLGETSQAATATPSTVATTTGHNQHDDTPFYSFPAVTSAHEAGMELQAETLPPSVASMPNAFEDVVARVANGLSGLEAYSAPFDAHTPARARTGSVSDFDPLHLVAESAVALDHAESNDLQDTHAFHPPSFLDSAHLDYEEQEQDGQNEEQDEQQGQHEHREQDEQLDDNDQD